MAKKEAELRCAYCGRLISKQGQGVNQATKDHVIPKSKGGNGKADNIRPACYACNNEKSDMSEEQYREVWLKRINGFLVAMGRKQATIDKIKFYYERSNKAKAVSAVQKNMNLPGATEEASIRYKLKSMQGAVKDLKTRVTVLEKLRKETKGVPNRVTSLEASVRNANNRLVTLINQLLSENNKVQLLQEEVNTLKQMLRESSGTTNIL